MVFQFLIELKNKEYIVKLIFYLNKKNVNYEIKIAKNYSMY